MTQKIVRYMVFALAAGLAMAALAACGSDPEPPPEPTAAPDVPATISAQLTLNAPTQTPTPEPTVPPTATLAPTPNIPATFSALQTMNAPTATPIPTATPVPTPTPMPTDTPVPPPTDTPVPPTHTPVPTPTPTPVPANTPTLRSLAHTDNQKRPAIIAGKVTIRGAAAGAGTIVEGKSAGYLPIRATTDANGIYRMNIGVDGVVLEMFVNAVSTGTKSKATKSGDLEALNLTVQ